MKDLWEAYVVDASCVNCGVVVDVAVVGTWRRRPRGWGEIRGEMRGIVATRGGEQYKGGRSTTFTSSSTYISTYTSTSTSSSTVTSTSSGPAPFSTLMNYT